MKKCPKAHVFAQLKIGKNEIETIHYSISHILVEFGVFLEPIYAKSSKPDYRDHRNRPNELLVLKSCEIFLRSADSAFLAIKTVFDIDSNSLINDTTLYAVPQTQLLHNPSPQHFLPKVFCGDRRIQ